METSELESKTQEVNTQAEGEIKAIAEDNAYSATCDEGSRRDHVLQAMEILYKAFPNCFIKEGDCKPLRIGIFNDLKGRIGDLEGLTLTKVRAALHFYTSRLRYLYCIKDGAWRVDPDGKEIEQVTAEHEAYSRTRMEELSARRKEKAKQRAAKAAETAREGNAAGEEAPRGDRPHGEDKGGQRPPFRKGGHPGKPRKAFVKYVKATPADLSPGTEVSVTTGGRKFVKGVVGPNGVKGMGVQVTLQTGATINLSVDRVMVPEKR